MSSGLVLNGFFLVFIAAIKLWPSAPFIRSLHKTIVEIPCVWLARAERRHIIVALIVVAMLMAGGEMLAIFGSIDAMVVYSLDLSLYLDAIGAVLAAAAAIRFKSAYHLVKARLASMRVGQFRGRMRSPSREVRSTTVRRPANDNDDGRAGRQAA